MYTIARGLTTSRGPDQPSGGAARIWCQPPSSRRSHSGLSFRRQPRWPLLPSPSSSSLCGGRGTSVRVHRRCSRPAAAQIWTPGRGPDQLHAPAYAHAPARACRPPGSDPTLDGPSSPTAHDWCGAFAGGKVAKHDEGAGGDQLRPGEFRHSWRDGFAKCRSSGLEFAL